MLEFDDVMCDVSVTESVYSMSNDTLITKYKSYKVANNLI